MSHSLYWYLNCFHSNPPPGKHVVRLVDFRLSSGYSITVPKWKGKAMVDGKETLPLEKPPIPHFTKYENMPKNMQKNMSGLWYDLLSVCFDLESKRNEWTNIVFIVLHTLDSLSLSFFLSLIPSPSTNSYDMNTTPNHLNMIEIMYYFILFPIANFFTCSMENTLRMQSITQNIFATFFCACVWFLLLSSLKAAARLSIYIL